MWKLGLTGGIGSGKSTVATILAELGAGVVDADTISKAATASNGVAMAAIARQFGAEMVTPENALNRERMRERVFRDPAAKASLEAIVHPLVGQEIARQVAYCAAAGLRCVVLDIPLLVETGHWRSQLDRVWVVDCLPATQVQRVMARNQLGRAEVERIMASQCSRERRLQAADAVLYNDGVDLQTLRAQTAQLAAPFGLPFRAMIGTTESMA